MTNSQGVTFLLGRVVFLREAQVSNITELDAVVQVIALVRVKYILDRANSDDTGFSGRFIVPLVINDVVGRVNKQTLARAEIAGSVSVCREADWYIVL